MKKAIWEVEKNEMVGEREKTSTLFDKLTVMATFLLIYQKQKLKTSHILITSPKTVIYHIAFLILQAYSFYGIRQSTNASV